MKRKLKLPSMSTKKVTKWSKTIRTIIKRDGTLFYLNQLGKKDVDCTISYLKKNKSVENEERVDFSKLSVLADLKVYHYAIIPTVSEVIEQIPRKLRKRVVAFYVVYNPIDNRPAFEFSRDAGEEFDSSIVRLYQAKDESNKRARMITEYPEKDSILPIGMDEEEFEEFKEFVMAERIKKDS